MEGKQKRNQAGGGRKARRALGREKACQREEPVLVKRPRGEERRGEEGPERGEGLGATGKAWREGERVFTSQLMMAKSQCSLGL